MTTIVNLYRPPSGVQSEFLEHITKLSDVFQEDNSHDLYLTGDVNLDHLCKQPNETTTSLSSLLKSYGFTQYIKEPTRVTATTKTTLDVMYVKTSKLIEPMVTRTMLSDHFLISCSRSLDYHKPQCKLITGRTYKHYTYEKAKSFYRRQRLDLLYQMDVNLAWETMLKYITNCANILCPFKQITVRQDPSPWITKELIEQLSDRDKAFELAYQTKNPRDLKIAKGLRTEVKRQVRNAKAEFIQTNLRNNSEDPKKFWEELNKLIKNTSTPKQIQLTDVKGQPITPNETPDYINSFFAQIGSNLAKNFPNAQPSTNNLPNDLPHLNLPNISQADLFRGNQ